MKARTTIDITGYGRPHPAKPSELYFVDAEHGKEVAEKTYLQEKLDGMEEVDIVLNERGMVPSCRPGESFVRGLVGPAARAVGINKFVERVSVNGRKLDLGLMSYDFCGKITAYLIAEKKRLEREAKKKARENGNCEWSETTRFLVPDIGTVVKLTKDWMFRLHFESRNQAMLNLVGKNDDYDWKRNGTVAGEVTIRAGAEMSVNRVYIRQGLGGFSSVTFYLAPKSEVETGGRKFSSKGKTRFWAKLSDVNKMEVRVDLKTLAEN